MTRVSKVYIRPSDRIATVRTRVISQARMIAIMFALALLALAVMVIARVARPNTVQVKQSPRMAITAQTQDAGILPDPNETPGIIATTDIKLICESGYSASVRPPVSYTNRIKRELMARHYPNGDTHDFELDHRLSLAMGGAASDPRNLWLESWDGPYGAHVKDRVENAVRAAICKGEITVTEGQAIFLGDWRDGLKYVHSKSER